MKTENPAMSRSIIIIGGLFFVFGFVTWLGSVLIPYLKIACELNNFYSYLVAFSFYISYMVMAVPAGLLLKRTGYKNGMALGLLLMAGGALLFIPAALTRAYLLFLLGLFIQGSGLAVLQTAANPYITILGPMESAARRISIMGICNGVAGAVAPLVLGAVVLSDAENVKNTIHTLSAEARVEQLNMLASKVIFPYSIIAVVLALLAVIVYYSSLPDIREEEETTDITNTGNKKTIIQFPHLLIGVLALFLYVGVEVIAGDTIIGYGASQGIKLSMARIFTSFTLSGMLLGYIIGIICIPKYIAQETALKVCALCGICFALAALFTTGYVSVTCIALLGLANSLIWPAIWPLALADLGRFTRMGSSLLIMAVGGGAVLPLLYGYFADRFSPHLSYWLVVPCYAFILYYAVAGHKIRTQKAIQKLS